MVMSVPTVRPFFSHRYWKMNVGFCTGTQTFLPRRSAKDVMLSVPSVTT